MAKLYPPLIAGTLPAFYGGSLTVPFAMNRAVSRAEIKGFAIKIKTVSTNTEIGTYRTEPGYINDVIDKAQISFSVNKNLFIIGQFYKVQLAYISNDEDSENGYFSTVGVIKYTAEPSISILNLDLSGKINAHVYDYTGVYNYKNDTTEKPYSYRFDLKDANGNIVATSGELLHNNNLDDSLGEATDTYRFAQDLDSDKIYKLYYTVTTVNGLVETSTRYRITQKESIDPEINVTLLPEVDRENGYIEVKMEGERTAQDAEIVGTGDFKILRADNLDNFRTWNTVLSFSLYGQRPSSWSWKDHTVQQGVAYKYALQQVNEEYHISSNRIESEPVFADFDHAYLFDGVRQLKIKYNPKVATFKNNILETKIDTIGGKYPFIFRNGDVKYKEFSISGLISCQSDENFLFVTEEDLKQFDNTSNLTSGNIQAERTFKLEVLEWLNNGQIKLFRSPGEGNYMVRLMNVSLTPIDTVGRMLHNFTATAYEVSGNSFDDLASNNIITVENPVKEELRWDRVDLKPEVVDSVGRHISGFLASENLLQHTAVSLKFENMIPGDQITIVDDAADRPYNTDGTVSSPQEYIVTIGATGSYSIDLSTGVRISSVRFTNSAENFAYTDRLEYSKDLQSPTQAEWSDKQKSIINHQGTLTYAYYSRQVSRFNYINNTTIYDVPAEQYIGQYSNILSEINNPKTKIRQINYLSFTARIPDTSYTYSYDSLTASYVFYKNNQVISKSSLDPYTLYKMENRNIPGKLIYVDGKNPGMVYQENEYKNKLFQVILNANENVFDSGSVIDLAETKRYVAIKPSDITSIKTEIGIVTEIGYRKQIVDYYIEDKTNASLYPTLAALKVKYEDAESDLINWIFRSDPALSPEGEEINTPVTTILNFKEIENNNRRIYNTAKRNYMMQLEKELTKIEEVTTDAKL